MLHAVESGSRAWGFESPDSDYDVRSIYVRRREDYLKLSEPRDVIEWQLYEVLDINGWDLRKALQYLQEPMVRYKKYFYALRPMGEAETRPQIPMIQTFIGSEIDRQKAWLDTAVDDRKPEWEPLDAVFLRTLGLLGHNKKL